MINKIRVLLYVIVFMLINNVFAQTVIPRLIVDFKHSNDFIYGTDHYFSSGMKLRVYGKFMSKSPINYILHPDSKKESVYYAITITHNIYTPTKIFTTEIQIHDQPYAAYLLVGSSKESFNLSNRLKKITEFQLWIIGPYAGGRFVQNSIHIILPTSDPAKGWENQVANDLAIQYKVKIEKGLINEDIFELNAYASGIIGSPHTEFSLGTFLRIGMFEDFFSGLGIGYGRDLQIYFFATGEITYMAYNAVLTGGLFHHGELFNIGNINHLLTYYKLGMTLVYKSLKLEVAQETLSPQFEGSSSHLWGNARIVIAF